MKGCYCHSCFMYHTESQRYSSDKRYNNYVKKMNHRVLNLLNLKLMIYIIKKMEAMKLNYLLKLP